MVAKNYPSGEGLELIIAQPMGKVVTFHTLHLLIQE